MKFIRFLRVDYIVVFLFSLSISNTFVLVSDAQASTVTLQSESTEQRLTEQRLMGLSKSLQEILINKVFPEILIDKRDRYYRKNSELHIRFQTGVVNLLREEKDAILLWPVQVSGFTNIINSKNKSENKRESGSDLRPVRVNFTDIFDKTGKAKATIQVPKFVHGSIFPAREIVISKVQDWVKAYFPNVQIEGFRKFNQKSLIVKNQTDEKILIKFYWKTRYFTDKGVKWEWKPGVPNQSKSFDKEILPGTQIVISVPQKQERHEPIKASRIRIIAQSQTGELWDSFWVKDLWLVPMNNRHDNHRVYFSNKMHSFIYTIAPKSIVKTFTERTLKLANETDETIKGTLRYRANYYGGIKTESLKFTISPSQSFYPRDERGFLIRASYINIEAESPYRKFTEHSNTPYWVVGNESGTRSYRSKKIGQFTYAFAPLANTPSAQVITVVNNRVPIQVESKVLKYANSGEVFTVTDVEGEWVGIEFDNDGKSDTGWIKKEYVRFDQDIPIPAPDQQKKMIRISTSNVPVKIEARTIGFVKEGELFHLLDKQDGWYYIKIKTDKGNYESGWIAEENAEIIVP